MNEVIRHALGIHGYTLQSDLEALYSWALEMGSIVEVGAWRGRSTYVLGKGCAGPVYAVDTFTGSPDEPEHVERVAAAGGSTLPEFWRNLDGCPNVLAVVKDSAQAAAELPDVDMVFIDGGHSYEQVLADLKAWVPKARKLICGHDAGHPPVARAVREVLGPVEMGPGLLWFKRVEVKRPAPLFSILHTSARPDKWRAVYDDWMSKAVHPEQVEYVLCIDPRWGFSLDAAQYDTPLDNLHVVQNTRRRCYVDGVDTAARASTGSILIVNADDQFACEGWDAALDRARLDVFRAWDDAFVIDVNTGTPDESQRGIMPMPILSRVRYEQQGYVFYPGYESMYADNDFCECARQDGVVIDARHLLFPHRHPLFIDGHWREMKPGDPDWDKAYQAQNNGAAFKSGAAILDKRKASGFPPLQHPSVRRTIALCLSGERFEGPWVDAILSLYGRLRDLEFSIMRLRPSSKTNVYVTREMIRRALMSSEVRPDLCLWIDDDNVLSVEHFDMLLSDLDAHPEVDGVAGWAWIHNEKKENFMVSCGEWAPDHLHWIPFPPSFARETAPRSFGCGGLPALLMKFEALEKAGDGAFLPVLDNRQEFGISGEDISFFSRAEKGGCKFLVDPRVRVPHLKYVEVCPVFPSEGGPEAVKVACMIRAKNEGRWIARTIESVRPLCGENIFVLEDGSTDDTVDVATLAGAIVIPSPFVGQGLDERRDKNWLLEFVREACSPDWVIMPDGDEELQIGGCDLIRRELEKNPSVDVLSLGVLNLWDSVDTRRVDGVYGGMGRQSLFRANSGLEFQSYYKGENENGNHCGLHCSNAPGLGQARYANLNVFLYHYGCLHREDRARKYEWITVLDPHNEEEGCYMHMVQGDTPLVPAYEKLKHGGPLKLEKLPARLVPKFDNGVPGPLALSATAQI